MLIDADRSAVSGVTWDKRVCWRGHSLPCQRTPRTPDRMLFQESTFFHSSLSPHSNQPSLGRSLPTPQPSPPRAERCVYVCVCAFVCASLCVPLCLCVSIPAFMCADLCVFVPVSLTISVCLHVCWCVSVCALVCQGSWSFQAGSATPTGLPSSQGLSPRGQRQELQLTPQHLCSVIYL